VKTIDIRSRRSLLMPFLFLFILIEADKKGFKVLKWK